MNARRDIDLHDPDMTLLGSTIVTVDQNASVAEALTIRDGRISAIRSSAAIRTLAGPRTTTIESRRPHRHPWLIDSHLHAIRGPIPALFALWRRGGLTLRVRYDLTSPNPGTELSDIKNLTQLLPPRFGDDWLRFNGLGEVAIWGMHDGSATANTFTPSAEANYGTASAQETTTRARLANPRFLFGE